MANLSTLLPFYLLMIPNFTTLIHGPVPFVGMFWSVGVEEQFYLAWPVLLKKIKANILGVFCGILIALISLRLLYFYHQPTIPNDYFTHFVAVQGSVYGISLFLYRLQFECMIAGGIGAYLLLNQSSYLQFLYRRDLQALNLLTITACVLAGKDFLFLDNLVYGFLFAILILNVGTNPRALFTLENRPMSYLGKISYGLYVYHFTVIVALLNALDFNSLGSATFNLLLYGGSIAGTILVCVLSYEYFEKPFLRAKKNYMTVKSSVNRLGAENF